MKVLVKKSFRWAPPPGNYPITVEAEQLVEGRCAEVALELGCGVELQKNATEAMPPRDKALDKAPRNAARRGARNKG